MKRLFFVLTCFRNMGASWPQLVLEAIKLSIPGTYRNEWYHNDSWHE